LEELRAVVPESSFIPSQTSPQSEKRLHLANVFVPGTKFGPFIFASRVESLQHIKKMDTTNTERLLVHREKARGKGTGQEKKRRFHHKSKKGCGTCK
jgi:hypothetical protein